MLALRLAEGKIMDTDDLVQVPQPYFKSTYFNILNVDTIGHSNWTLIANKSKLFLEWIRHSDIKLLKWLEHLLMA